ncbi:MFS transporter [Actinophytocola sp.]|uniref:MFS transporter n=1 Tax=Actinophytocola sp. TaxID=1872138 RepID=UPI002ED2E3A4
MNEVTSEPTTSILSRPVVMLLVTSFGALSGFCLLLSVVPLYVARAGGGEVGAGLVTGAMMLATVLVELIVPRLLARLGYRAVMAAGLLLLGAPALALVGSPATALVLAMSLFRGAGLGIVVVVGSALAAELAPPSRRAEALALYGVVVGVPGIVGLPAGLWLSEHVGFTTVFAAAAAVALLPLVAVPALPARSGRPVGGGSVLGVRGGLARLAVIFTAFTFAGGVFATFLPLAVPAGTAAGALLVQALTTPVARYAAGRFAGRRGSGPLLVPSVLAAAAGAALLVLGGPLATVTGMALFGAGYGAAQNVTLALMMERVDSTDYGRTSALWNLAFDAGFGLGAVGFGLVVGPVGYAVGFALTAAVLVAVLAPAVLDRKEHRHGHSRGARPGGSR